MSRHHFENLTDVLDFLKRWMTKAPTGGIIEYAAFLMTVYPREVLPDWVEALANGNPDELEAVIEIALDDMNEEENDDRTENADEH